MEEPGGLQSMESQRARQDWATSIHSVIAQLVKNPPAMQETPVRFLGWEDPLEKGEDTHSGILGLPLWLSWWRICLQCGRPEFNPWVGKIPWRKERLPTPVFWPGEFHELQSMGSQRVIHDWEMFIFTFMLFIRSLELICVIYECLYPLTNISPFHPPLSPGHHHSTLCFYE